MQQTSISVTTPAAQEANADHVDYLDGWRGVAIIMLLIGHLFPVPGIYLGVFGVNLFFVLSGLLMGRLLFIRQTPLPVFYRRRISRIVPAHVVFILCTLLWYAFNQLTIDWPETLSALFFTKNYLPGHIGHTVMPFGHIWSLSVEEHSYIVLAIVAFVSRRKWISAPAAIAVLAACSVLAGLWYAAHYSGSELEFGKWVRSEVSAYGILMSSLLLLLLHARPGLRVPALLCPLLFLGGLALHWWSVSLPVKTTIGVGMLALSINLLPQAPAFMRSALSIRPLKILGLWSFSIYLWQQPFYNAVYRGSLTPIVALLLSLLCGVSSYYLLERPVRRYLNAVWGRPREEAAPNADARA